MSLEINKMADWKVYDIVKILVKDEALLGARRRLPKFLYIPGDSLKEIEDDYRENKDIHSYFCDVLEKWKSINGKDATISSLTNILSDNEFVALAEQLSTLNGDPVKGSVAFSFGVKEPVFNFVGREKELKELNELFLAKKSCVVLSSAMGGKGKTELCRRFIQQLPKDIETLVTWFSGDGQQQFNQSLSNVGQTMNVKTKDSTGKLLSVDKLIENIASKRKSKWVVIIDNVEQEFPDFFPSIDTFLRNGAFVVITSRKTEIQTEKQIFLEDLEDKDAWEFVRSALNQSSQELNVKLCKSLQNYPLVLQQAVAFIKYKQSVEDNSYGIEEYLQELNLDNSKVFDHKVPITGYDHTILKVFELTIKKIINTTDNRMISISLLQILALVLPDGISKEFIKKLFSFFELEELLDSSLSILKSFSLIGVNKGEVSIHRIVQQLIRDKMKTENRFHLVIDQMLENIYVYTVSKKEITQVIQICKNAFSESEIVRKNSNFAVRLCNRLVYLSLYREMKDFSETNFKQFFKFLGTDHLDTLRMQFQLGVAIEYNGEYEEALVILQKLWEKEKKVLGEEDEDTLDCAGEIALVLWRLKKLDESLEWHEKVLKSKAKVHDENHQSTMNTKNNMAIVLNEQGKSEEALFIYNQVLEWREKELGYEHPDTLITRHNIAACLYNQDKFNEAKKEFEEVLELRVKFFGEDHAVTLITKSFLSSTLYSLGEKDEAHEMLEQVLISREKVLGQNHPNTNMTRNRISEWKDLKDLKDNVTLEFVESSLTAKFSKELIKKLCKCLYNFSIAAQLSVAFIKYKQSVEEDYGIEEYLHELDLNNSKAFNQKNPTIYSQTVNKVIELTLSEIINNPSDSGVLTLLQIVSLLQPDGIEIKFFKKLFSYFEKEESFDSTISTLKSFSLIGINNGEISVHQTVQKFIIEKTKAENKLKLVITKIFEKLDAEKLTMKEILQVNQIWKNALQESETIKKNSNFAVKICNRLRELGLYTEMKDISKITVKQFVRVLELDHLDTLRMQFQLGLALEENGEYEEALVKLQFVLKKQKQVFGENYEETIKSTSQIAKVLRRLKKFDDSLKLHEQVLRSQVEVYGKNNKFAIETMNTMAGVMIEHGKSEEAMNIWKQVLVWEKRELGHEHPYTLSIRHNIATCLHNQGKFIEAKKELEDILGLRIKVQGKDYLGTTQYSLSLTLYSLGQIKEAFKIMKEVLLIREKVLGSNHPETNLTRSWLSKWNDL